MKTVKFMKKGRFLLTTALLGTCLTACSDDPKVDDPIDEVTGKDYLIDEVYENGKRASKYEYDNKNRLVKLTAFALEEGETNVISTYSYNGDGQVISSKVTTGSDVITTGFEYDNDGKLTKSTMSDGDSNVMLISNYTYQGNKTIVTGASGGNTVSVSTYIMEGTNIVRQEYDIPGMPQMSWVLERSDFDGKKLPAGLPGGLPFGNTGSNPRREKMTSVNGFSDFDWEWKYTYNDAGYVTTATNYSFGSEEAIDVFQYKLIKAK